MNTKRFLIFLIIFVTLVVFLARCGDGTGWGSAPATAPAATAAPVVEATEAPTEAPGAEVVPTDPPAAPLGEEQVDQMTCFDKVGPEKSNKFLIACVTYANSVSWSIYPEWATRAQHILDTRNPAAAPTAPAAPAAGETPEPGAAAEPKIEAPAAAPTAPAAPAAGGNAGGASLVGLDYQDDDFGGCTSNPNEAKFPACWLQKVQGGYATPTEAIVAIQQLVAANNIPSVDGWSTLTADEHSPMLVWCSGSDTAENFIPDTAFPLLHPNVDVRWHYTVAVIQPHPAVDPASVKTVTCPSGLNSTVTMCIERV